MITLDLIGEFVNSDIGLRYKYHIKVIAYHLYGDYIHIMFREGGELVLLEKYYNWLKLTRDSKLEMIGI
jgi:hypothetical protein